MTLEVWSSVSPRFLDLKLSSDVSSRDVFTRAGAIATDRLAIPTVTEKSRRRASFPTGVDQNQRRTRHDFCICRADRRITALFWSEISASTVTSDNDNLFKTHSRIP